MKHYIPILLVLMISISACKSPDFNEHWDGYYSEPPTTVDHAIIKVEKNSKEPFIDYHFVVDRHLVLNRNKNYELRIAEGVRDLQLVTQRYKYQGHDGEKNVLHSATMGWYRVPFKKGQVYKINAITQRLHLVEDGENKEIIINTPEEKK